MPTTSYPPGGISAGSAKAIAIGYSTPNQPFLSQRAGAYGDLEPFIGSGPAGPVPMTTWVWAVQFSAVAAPCGGPPAAVCESPRPGTFTVVLDYYTGRFITSVGFFPNPD